MYSAFMCSADLLLAVSPPPGHLVLVCLATTVILIRVITHLCVRCAVSVLCYLVCADWSSTIESLIVCALLRDGENQQIGINIGGL